MQQILIIGRNVLLTNDEQLTSSGQRTDKDIGMAERLQEKSHSRFLPITAQTAESINLEKTKTMTFPAGAKQATLLSRKILYSWAGRDEISVFLPDDEIL